MARRVTPGCCQTPAEPILKPHAGCIRSRRTAARPSPCAAVPARSTYTTSGDVTHPQLKDASESAARRGPNDLDPARTDVRFGDGGMVRRRREEQGVGLSALPSGVAPRGPMKSRPSGGGRVHPPIDPSRSSALVIGRRGGPRSLTQLELLAAMAPTLEQVTRRHDGRTGPALLLRKAQMPHGVNVQVITDPAGRLIWRPPLLLAQTRLAESPALTAKAHCFNFRADEARADDRPPCPGADVDHYRVLVGSRFVVNQLFPRFKVGVRPQLRERPHS